MLIGLLNALFAIVIFLVKVASWLMLAYVLMSLLIPQNKYTLLVGKYAEPVLAPIRALIARLFPKVAATRFDFSPLAFWLLLDVLVWVLELLRKILL